MEGEYVLPVPSPFPWILSFAPEMVADNESYINDLKAECDNLTTLYYADQLSPCIEGGHNQMEYYEAIKQNITWLLSRGFFLRGGFDDNVFTLYILVSCITFNPFIQGMTINFGNPLIADICKSFYYNGGQGCLAVLFPSEFEELPRECLAMVCTHVRDLRVLLFIFTNLVVDHRLFMGVFYVC